MGRILGLICAVVVAVGLAGASPTQVPNLNPLYAACEKGEANRQSDLCAQWHAADSAREAAIWTRRVGWFTGIGLLIGAVTMGAAIAAAMFAKQAADHTRAGALSSAKMVTEAEKTTKAAADAVEVSRQAMIAQDRAWITVSATITKPLVFDDDSITTEIAVTYKNIGASPATNVSIIFANIYPSSSEASRAVSQNTQWKTHISVFTWRARVMFPKEKHREVYSAIMPVARFHESIIEMADYGREQGDTDVIDTGHPAIVVGVEYALAGERKRRVTIAGFVLLNDAREDNGFSGAEATVNPTGITLMPDGSVGITT